MTNFIVNSLLPLLKERGKKRKEGLTLLLNTPVKFSSFKGGRGF
jgi:hypothetical protein